MTVREFMENLNGNVITVFSQCGYVDMTEEEIQNALQKPNNNYIDDVLNEDVLTINFGKGAFHILSGEFSDEKDREERTTEILKCLKLIKEDEHIRLLVDKYRGNLLTDSKFLEQETDMETSNSLEKFDKLTELFQDEQDAPSFEMAMGGGMC